MRPNKLPLPYIADDANFVTGMAAHAVAALTRQAQPSHRDTCAATSDFMTIDLHRTFSLHTARDETNPNQDWEQYFGMRSGGKTWDDIHEKPLAVILGEAGIGKTIEFELEVHRLRTADQFAFFLPLNLLVDDQSWDVALSADASSYASWLATDRNGYFFLDAVDEARLKSHADFQRALAFALRALKPNLTRVRVAISSRITDWSVPAVRLAVNFYLGRPIEHAIAAATTETLTAPVPILPTTEAPEPAEAERVEPLVVELDPLSESEARRCAESFGVTDTAAFWSAVASGDYEFMATRPLDLRWMTVLWKERGTLGRYLELIEANVGSRLKEFNPNYVVSGNVLSPEQLLVGATELAAAAEFGSCPYFSLNPAASAQLNEIAPETVLPTWRPDEILRLLATAVFDEASFCRVKFHHRSVREYLAAQWVNNQLTVGVPLLRLKRLFAGSPFGEPVLIPSRRACLSWLAAINVEAREWVVRDFPEILLFEGDPQSWDELSVNKAFSAYIEAAKISLQANWFNSASEYLRVGRALSPGKVAAAIATTSSAARVRSLCFQLAKHSKLADCARPAFDVYRNPVVEVGERRQALDALEVIATPEQRNEVLADLTAGTLRSNELIACALTVADWTSLDTSDLAKVFASSQSEADYGAGPMVRKIKFDILPTTTAASAHLMVTAVMAAMPRPEAGKRFTRFPEADRPERAWLLDILPDCFERLLNLYPGAYDQYQETCLKVAERLDAQRDSGFTDRDQIARLQKAIARHSELRWKIALAIAQSVDVSGSTNRLTWGAPCLVSFGAEDLAELTLRANDTAAPKAAREIWFSVAAKVTLNYLRRRARTTAFNHLLAGSDFAERATQIGALYCRLRAGANQMREYEVGELERRRQATEDFAGFKAKLTGSLESIRSGSSFGLLCELLNYSFNVSGRHNFSPVDFGVIASGLGEDISRAFQDGLVAYWPTVVPPDPSQYSGGRLPWLALVALAGAYRSLIDQSVIPSLNSDHVEKAAQLAVWELQTPPPWFAPLARAHQSKVQSALGAWILAEAQADSPGNGVRGALETALRCPADVRARLIAPVATLVTAGQVINRETLWSLIDVLREDGQLVTADIGALCQGKLATSIGTDGCMTDTHWLRVWFENDAPSAWAWFQQHLRLQTDDLMPTVTAFASAIGDLKWLKAPVDQQTADILFAIHALVGAHPPPNGSEAEADESSRNFDHPTRRLRGAIPNLLVSVRGPVGNLALRALEAKSTDPQELSWLRSQLTAHAALDAAQYSSLSAADLRSVNSPFLTEPKSETQLYEQVVARLDEIREGIENGPFSERVLFSASMPEKHLQLWLAAKFRDTKNCRFTAHREEEVDDDNKTDIQLSASTFNVCVEIKPVDGSRNYSANSLVDTLKTQIVEKYLKGYNSSRGILVLMQLDNKRWDIPNGARGQEFSELLKYLAVQAQSIKNASAGVSELSVVGIRCIV